jgi:hypothetical protein
MDLAGSRGAEGLGADRPGRRGRPCGTMTTIPQSRSAEMGIGIREGGAPSRPLLGAGSHGSSPSPANIGLLLRGAVLRSSFELTTSGISIR